MHLTDMTPALFLSDGTAAAAARSAVERMETVRKAVVLPHTYRGEMQGYLVMMHFIDRYRRARPMTDAEFLTVARKEEAVQ